jgi:hypothetical protein
VIVATLAIGIGANSAIFSIVDGSFAAPTSLPGRDQPERVDGVRTESSLLQMLGARPPLGRLLLPEEDKPGKPAVS